MSGLYQREQALHREQGQTPLLSISPSGAVSGVIYVWGNNLCGDGINSPPFYVTVDPLPGPAGTITGASDVCVGTTGVAYSVTAIPNATGYDWIVPSGVVITSGKNNKRPLLLISHLQPFQALLPLREPINAEQGQYPLPILLP